ncbi:MFS transporter [Streptomyces sp. TG1A-8]|uniref:MFS transporter n=1 Tax=Streptomyces sp. TG1A-8 TaxID=3051385 RepID=UPI00265BEB4D|nr:MFS transporter [Streptomyces sp. TG1A-8]MDO0930182.1 MFS transporter [Streptomyces sp. TG1A-8]
MKSTMFRNHPVLTASTTVKSLLVTALVNATGTGAFMSGSVLYFSSHLRIPDDTVAFTLSVCALVTLVTTVPLSAFLERFDLKRIIIVLHIFRGLLYSSYLLADSVPLFIAVTLVVTIADRLSNPASQALLAAVLPSDQRVEIMAWRYSLQNAGVGFRCPHRGSSHLPQPGFRLSVDHGVERTFFLHSGYPDETGGHRWHLGRNEAT